MQSDVCLGKPLSFKARFRADPAKNRRRRRPRNTRGAPGDGDAGKRSRTRNEGPSAKKIAPGVQFRVLEVSVAEMVGKGRADRGAGSGGTHARRETLHGENLAHDRVGGGVGARDMSLCENHVGNFTTAFGYRRHDFTDRKSIRGNAQGRHPDRRRRGARRRSESVISSGCRRCAWSSSPSAVARPWERPSRRGCSRASL